MLSHELKNRFVGVRGLVDNARLTVEEKAGHLLQEPHNLQEAFADAAAAVDRGLFICINRAVTLQLAQGTYKLREVDMEVAKELGVASAKRCDVQVDAEVPTIVRADSNLVLHVAENFLANAQNYGPEGRGDDKTITMRASLDAGRLRITVQNRPGPRHADLRLKYGEGDALAHILAEGGIQTSATSTGHGLRIIRRCANMLRGTASLRFLADRVVAALVLPLVAVKGGAPQLPFGLRVASLDDDDMVRASDRRLFAKLHFEAHVRGATEEEIVGFPAFVASLDPPPDVVLLDEHLDHPTRGGPFAKGTRIVPQLKDAGFAGKVRLSRNDAWAVLPLSLFAPSHPPSRDR